jgi:hypothetical protein
MNHRSCFFCVPTGTSSPSATIFPHNIGLGETRDPDLIKRIGAATAFGVRATGIPYVFSSCLAVCRDPRWGRCYEGYCNKQPMSSSSQLHVRPFWGLLTISGLVTMILLCGADGRQVEGPSRKFIDCRPFTK